MIGRKALATIHIRKTQLNLDDGAYRALLKARYGVSTAKDLTDEQYRDLLRYFGSFQTTGNNAMCRLICAPRQPGEPIPPAIIYGVSPRQLSVIKKLRDDIRWKIRGGFEAWLWRYFRLQKIETSIEATKVIAALKGLWRSQHCCAYSLVTKTERHKGEDV
jgi:hypothetical protein